MKEITRQGVIYRQLPNGTLTCGALDQSGKLGGTGEEYRNEVHNPARAQRIKEFHPNPVVLDYGCGTGKLVDYLQTEAMIVAVGFDKFIPSMESLVALNKTSNPAALGKELFDVVTMIEVIEHTAAPYEELDMIYKTLKPGGILMVETSFTDWMDLESDPYINPTIGHSTIFSHAGLDELMKEKGFEIYGHINRNVRVYQKPGEYFDNKITLITMGQANPQAFRNTIHSFKPYIDEIVFGDLLIFDSDRELIERFEYPCKTNIVKLPFNYIFKNGFAATLNHLAEQASNDWILYMNVSEVMDGEHDIKIQMSKEYNCYSFDHAVEAHRWLRLYNRQEVKWGGLIHEEVVGDLRPCPFNVFRMKDTEKDLDDPFKAKVSNDVKEITYWTQLCKLVDNPELVGNTHQGWVDFAREQYAHNQERMKRKGKRVEAFQTGNLTMYLEDIYTNPEFEQERFISSASINFQGDRKLL